MKDNQKDFSIIDAMNNLFRFTSAGALNSNEIALYVILISKWNELGRPHEFNLSRGIILSNSGMSKDAFYRTRNKLKQKGLIDFQIRSGNQSSTYIVCPKLRTQSATQTATQSATIHRVEKSREKLKEKKSIKEKKKASPSNRKKGHELDEDVSKEVYDFISEKIGRPSIAIFKKNRVPLEFVKWLIQEKKIQLGRIRQPVFYICAMAKNPSLMGEFHVWLGERDKESLKGVIQWQAQA